MERTNAARMKVRRMPLRARVTWQTRAAAEVAEGDASIGPGHRDGGGDFAGAVERGGEFGAVGDDESDDVPAGQADEDAADVSPEALRRGEEEKLRGEGGAVGAGEDGVQARLADNGAEEKQAEAEAAADDEHGAPIVEETKRAADDRTEDADGRDHHGAVTAQFAGQDLGDEGDAAAQLAREAEAGDEPAGGVPVHIVDEGVGEVGGGVEDDGAEEEADASAPVAEQAPEDAADEHAAHLPVEEPGAIGDEGVAAVAEAGEAGFADEEEEDEVVDVDEVAEGADDDGRVEEGGDDFAGRVLGRFTAVGHAIELTQGLFAERGGNAAMVREILTGKHEIRKTVKKT